MAPAVLEVWAAFPAIWSLHLLLPQRCPNIVISDSYFDHYLQQPPDNLTRHETMLVWTWILPKSFCSQFLDPNAPISEGAKERMLLLLH